MLNSRTNEKVGGRRGGKSGGKAKGSRNGRVGGKVKYIGPSKAPPSIDHAAALNSGFLVGTCTTMCPANEMRIRQTGSDLNEFEIESCERVVTSDNKVKYFKKTNSELAVKKYRRSAAGRSGENPSEIRNIDTLMKTMNYLIDKIVKPCMDNFSIQGFLKQFYFVSDRFRAIRQDFTIQGNLCCKELIQTLEQQSRFYIISLYILRDLHDINKFDKKLCLEQLMQCLIPLIDQYKHIQSHESGVFDKDLLRYQNDFICYLLLLQIDNAAMLLHDLNPILQRQTKELKLVILFISNYKTSTFNPIFNSILPILSLEFPLMMCIVFKYVISLKISSLRILNYAFSPNESTSIKRLNQLLGDDQFQEQIIQVWGINSSLDDRGELKFKFNKKSTIGTDVETEGAYGFDEVFFTYDITQLIKWNTIIKLKTNPKEVISDAW